MSVEQAGCHECRIVHGAVSPRGLTPVRRGAFVIHSEAGRLAEAGRFVVVPECHVSHLGALSADQLATLGPLLAELTAALREEMGCEEPDVTIEGQHAHLRVSVVARRPGESAGGPTEGGEDGERAIELARRVLGHLAREARTPWRPALLSGLVWPGLGQLAKHQYTKGLLLMTLSLLVAIGVAFRIARDVLESLWSNPSELDLIQLVVAAQRVREASGGFVLLGSLALAALWIYAVADAYRSPPRP